MVYAPWPAHYHRRFARWTVAVVAVAAVVVACGGRHEPTGAGGTGAARPPSSASPPSAGGPTSPSTGSGAGAPPSTDPPTACVPCGLPPETSAGGQAARAYVDAITAWNLACTGTAPGGPALAAYYDHFAPTLDCWYGARGRTLDQVRHTRVPGEGETLGIIRLAVLHESADEVLLLDVGIDGGAERVHEKEVLLRRADDRWTIAGETSARSPGCLPAHPDATAAGCDDRTLEGVSRDTSGEGNGGAIAQAEAEQDALRCKLAVAGGPLWQCVPRNGALARMEDVVWTDLRALDDHDRPCARYAPTSVLLHDLDGDGTSEALVLAGGVANVFELRDGRLERRARLSSQVDDESEDGGSDDDVSRLELRGALVVITDARGEHHFASRGTALVDVDREALARSVAGLTSRLAHAPDDVAARCALAEAHRSGGEEYLSDHDYAQALASAGSPTTPADRHALAACLLTRGRTLASAGEVSAARADLERSVALEPSDGAHAALAALPAADPAGTVETWLGADAAHAPFVPGDALTGASVTDPSRPRRALAHLTFHAGPPDEVWLADGLMILRDGTSWRALGGFPGTVEHVSFLGGPAHNHLVRVDTTDAGSPITTLVWAYGGGSRPIMNREIDGRRDVWVGYLGTVVVGVGEHGEPPRVFDVTAPDEPATPVVAADAPAVPIAAPDVLASVSDGGGRCSGQIVARVPLPSAPDRVRVAEGPDTALVAWASRGRVQVAGIDATGVVGSPRTLAGSGPGAGLLAAVPNDDGFTVLMRTSTGVRIHDLDRTGALRGSFVEPVPPYIDAFDPQCAAVAAGGAMLFWLTSIEEGSGEASDRLLVLRRVGGALAVATRWDVPDDLAEIAFDGTHAAYVGAGITASASDGAAEPATIWIDGHTTRTTPFDVPIAGVRFVDGHVEALASGMGGQGYAGRTDRIVRIAMNGTVTGSEVVAPGATLRAPFDGLTTFLLETDGQLVLRRTTLNGRVIDPLVGVVQASQLPTSDATWSRRRRWVVAYVDPTNARSLVVEALGCRGHG